MFADLRAPTLTFARIGPAKAMTIAGAIAFATGGCGGYETIVSARLVDPYRVVVRGPTADGGSTTVVPAGRVATSVPLSRGVSPRGSDDAWVTRAADGSLTIDYDRPFGISCSPLTADGVLELTISVCNGAILDDTSELRVDYAYRPGRGRHTPRSVFSFTMATPWENVVEVRERKTLNRVGGWVLLVLGSTLTVVGSLALTRVIGNKDEFLGALSFGAGAVMLPFGVFNAFFPERERVLFSR